MKLATWNINGIKARQAALLAWLEEAGPDLVCLQEIKSVDEAFPAEPIEALGYNVATHGQKGFNGVAILSKRPLEDVTRGLPGDEEDVQARWLEATVSGESGALRVVALYLPNGNPAPGPKFDYKLAWMERMQARVAALLAEETPLVLAGDYNVIPEPRDCLHPDRWVDDALFRPESREAWRRLVWMGLTDATRAQTQEEAVFTFWDYQRGAWEKNDGIRIDHLLMSAQAADLLEASGVDAHIRGRDKPSDHVPVWAELSL